MVGVDREPLAEPAPVLVSAHLERHGCGLPSCSAVAAAEDRGGIAVIHAGGEIDGVRILRIGGDALDPEIAAFREAVLEWNPALPPFLPAVGAAHVRAQKGEAFLNRREDDVRCKPAAADDNVAPFIGDDGGVRAGSGGNDNGGT